jgi:hypothetical protein
MSYFAGGFKTTAALSAAQDALLAGLLPKHLPAESFAISEAPFLTVYGHNKVIPHAIIRGEPAHSWIAVIGTPLLRLNSDRDRQALLDAFFSNPRICLLDVIDGNFALFAYDGQLDRFFAATDLNSTTPVFYAPTGDGYVFSSHELAIARLLMPQIDPVGFAEAIHLGVTWGSRTRFSNVSKLQPGELLSVDAGRQLRLERYWQPSDEKQWSGSLDEHVERWRALLRDSVWRFYDAASRQPVVCDFTGGEDARLIVAQCHALKIPFRAHVKGAGSDVDLRVALAAAKKAEFDVIARERHYINRDQLLEHALSICVENDAYLEYFSACTDFATNLACPLDDYGCVKYGGVPGGEAFRGSYYLRGKALFPSRMGTLDYTFFTRMKFLLDYRVGLLQYSDAEFIDAIHEIIRTDLQKVGDFPVGIQIDHLLRVFQTCCVGLMYKDPLYLPLATNRLTRSIYSLPPHIKRGGRLTRACTEILFPELARTRTQNGVPTIRRTLRRQPLFIPEYASLARTIANGALGRLAKWKRPDAWQYREAFTASVFMALLNEPPYSGWFESSRAMMTGAFYNPSTLDGLLDQARTGWCRHIPTLARIMGHELAVRWVHRESAVMKN